MTVTKRGSDFAPLLREIKHRGLLDRRIDHYAVSIVVNLICLASVWSVVALVGNTWWVLALAVPLALFSVRTMFFGHDAGHQQIGSSRRVHDLLGMLHGNLLMGMSYSWWNDKHNRHHANPNHTGKDPDVGEGVLVWTMEQASGRTGLHGWLTRNQAWLFFPLLLLEGFNLKVSSLRGLWSRSRAEGWLIVVHYVLYAGLLLAFMSPGKALAFAALHHMLFGLHLGSVFAPNHKGMEMPDSDTNWGHLEKQVLTSRNVDGGPVTDWLMGGLNYQIEHHLFPNMPRQNLRLAQPVVRAYCERIGMPYVSTSVLASYRQALHHMHTVGEDLRTRHNGGAET